MRMWAAVALSAAGTVNPFIGTGGYFDSAGMTSPAATRPFGMVRLGPDTRVTGGRAYLSRITTATSGYSSWYNRIVGFSHTRLSGTGAAEGGLFRVQPLASIEAFASRQEGLPFEHADETAHPGTYAVAFPAQGFSTELTATARCGVHRYRALGQGPVPLLALDVTSSLNPKRDRKVEATLRVDPTARTLDGKVRLFGGFSRTSGGQQAWFHAEVTGPVEHFRLWRKGALLEAEFTQAEDPGNSDLGVLLLPSQEGRELEFRLCVSFVSAENARGNFDAEVRGRSFEQLKADANQEWEAWLGRARIRSRNAKVLTVFNTALYHSFLMPTLFTDSNGQYLGFDQKVRTARGFTYRTDLSLWDTFRTTHPLYTLIAPEIQRDSVQSLLEMARASGAVPRWPSGTADAGAMFGSPANFLFAETWLKGLRGFEPQEALDWMVRGAKGETPTSLPGREKVCWEKGICPSDVIDHSVSKTLDYAWADSATAGLARSLGQFTLARQFDGRAQAYRQAWNPERGFFAPKDSGGRWMRFTTDVVTYLDFWRAGKPRFFAEGSAHQWRYSAPHDAQGLIELFGGPEPFVQELESFLHGASPHMSLNLPQTHYWHGNEHNLHVIYLFNEAGRPDLTQRWARWAMQTRYGTGPQGLDGNDDGGALSAWYVFSALGLYPQAGTDRYWLGSPQVDEAELDLGEGRTLRILARNQGAKNVYVQGVRLNGQCLERPEVRQESLLNGVLEFDLGPAPAPGGGYRCGH